MTKDQKRIAWIATIMDGIGDKDFHELASAAHEQRCGCHSGPIEVDYYKGVAAAIDAARAAEGKDAVRK